MTNRHGDRVARAVRTLLERERRFDSRTRQDFWSTHIRKVAVWHRAMADALASNQWTGTADEIAVLRRTVDEMSAVSDVAIRVRPEAAHQDPDAFRALVFSTVIAYIATAYDGTNDIHDQWNAYEEALWQFGTEPRTFDTILSGALQQEFCTECGVAISRTTKFCWNCGAKQAREGTANLRNSTGSRVLRGVIWAVIGFIAGQLASAVVLISLAVLIGPDTSPWHQLAALGVSLYVGYTGYKGTLSSRPLNWSYDFIRAHIGIFAAGFALLVLIIAVSQSRDPSPSKDTFRRTESNRVNVPVISTPTAVTFNFSQQLATATPRPAGSFATPTRIKYRVAGHGYPRGKIRVSYVDSNGQYRVEFGDVSTSAWTREVNLPRTRDARISVQPLVGSATCEIYVNDRLAISRVTPRSSRGMTVCEL